MADAPSAHEIAQEVGQRWRARLRVPRYLCPDCGMVFGAEEGEHVHDPDVGARQVYANAWAYLLESSPLDRAKGYAVR